MASSAKAASPGENQLSEKEDLINGSLTCDCNYSNQSGAPQRLNCPGCSLKINGNTENASASFSDKQQYSESRVDPLRGKEQESEDAVKSPNEVELTQKLTQKTGINKGGFRKTKKTTSKKNTKNKRTKRRKVKSKAQNHKQPKRRTNKYK